MVAANRRSRTRRRRLMLAALCFATAGWAIFFIPWLTSPDASRLQHLAAFLSLRSLQSRLWPSHSLERVIQPHQHTPLLPLLPPYPQRLSLTGRFMLPSETEQAQRDTLHRLASEYETISADAQLMYNSKPDRVRAHSKLETPFEPVQPASNRATEHMLPLDIYPGYAVAITEQPQAEEQRPHQQQWQQQPDTRPQPLPTKGRPGELATLGQPHAAASLPQQQHLQPQVRELPQLQKAQLQPQQAQQQPQQPQLHAAASLSQQQQPQSQKLQQPLQHMPQQQPADVPRPTPRKKGKKKKSKAGKAPKPTARPRIPATDPPEDPELQRLASLFVISEIGASQQLEGEAHMQRPQAAASGDADSGSALNVHLTVRKALPTAVNQRASTIGQSQLTQKQVPHAAMDQQASAADLPQQAQQQIVHPAQKRVGAVFDGVGLQQTLADVMLEGDLPGGLADLEEPDRDALRMSSNPHAASDDSLDEPEDLDVMGLLGSQDQESRTVDSRQAGQQAAVLAGLRGLPASAADVSASLRRDPGARVSATQRGSTDADSNAVQFRVSGQAGAAQVNPAQAVGLTAREADLLWPRTTLEDARAADRAADLDDDTAADMAAAVLGALGDDDGGADEDDARMATTATWRRLWLMIRSIRLTASSRRERRSLSSCRCVPARPLHHAGQLPVLLASATSQGGHPDTQPPASRAFTNE